MGRKKMNRLTRRILIEIAVMVSVTVLLVVLIGNTWASYGEPEGTEPPVVPSGGNTDQVDPNGLDAFIAANGLSKSDYPSWLLKEFDSNAENATFILNYPLRYGVSHNVNLTANDTSKVPMLIQWDDRWGYDDYSGEIIGTSGAGPTCLSMVAYYLTGEVTYTPTYFANFAEAGGYALERGGTDWTLFSEGAVSLGLKVTEIPNVRGAVEQYLEAGIPVVVHVGPGDYTDSGHYMVLTGLNNGRITLNDPMSAINSQLPHEWENITKCALKFWAIQK